MGRRNSSPPPWVDASTTRFRAGDFMRLRSLIVVLGLLATNSARADDELQELLFHKFKLQNQAEAKTLRDDVAIAVEKATALKETDPDQGIDLLRAAANRVDGVKLLSGAERKALADQVKPLLTELRGISLQRRRDKASNWLEAFKEYLEVSAFEGRFPGRSDSKWEPAVFMTPDGVSRVGKLYTLGTGLITFRYGNKEQNQLPATFALIQVFGGFYVYDFQAGHQIFMTNREFYDYVVRPFVRDYDRADVPGRTRLTAAEMARRPIQKLLDHSIATGEFFLRSLPDLEPIPGIGSNEAPFFEFLAQTLLNKSLPVPLERVYPTDLQDRLLGFSKMQLSAVRRTLLLLQAKDTAVSAFYAEILRDEVTQLLKSEYTNFSPSEINRAVLYIFSKLK